MTDIKVGDEIKVTFTGTVKAKEGMWVDLEWGDGSMTVSLAPAEVEVLTPADDPSKDPVGTVRSLDGRSFVKAPVGLDSEYPWRDMDYAGGNSDVTMGGSLIIGAVPGTPAAKAQAPTEPQVVQYGDPEPDRSKKFKEPDGYIWSFFSGQWGWSFGEGSCWNARGPFISVTVSEFPWVEVVS